MERPLDGDGYDSFQGIVPCESLEKLASHSNSCRAVIAGKYRIECVLGEGGMGDELMLGRILRCNVAACGDAGAVVAATQDHPHAVVTDKTHVYWTNTGTSSGTGSVMRVAK